MKNIAKLDKILLFLVFTLLLLHLSCSSNQTSKLEITVAAASSLKDCFAEMAQEFELETGIKIVFSFGATANLAKQLEYGAPFDMFAAADLRSVEQLEQKGAIINKKVYAKGRLVLWWPQDRMQKPEKIEDTAKSDFKRIAVAKPETAPYGMAAKEALENLDLWKKVEEKIIFSENVNAARQYAESQNVQLAFIPLSLVKKGESYLLVDEQLHNPIYQAICISAHSKQIDSAKVFDRFISSPKGRLILEKYGYSIP